MDFESNLNGFEWDEKSNQFKKKNVWMTGQLNQKDRKRPDQQARGRDNLWKMQESECCTAADHSHYGGDGRALASGALAKASAKTTYRTLSFKIMENTSCNSEKPLYLELFRNILKIT